MAEDGSGSSEKKDAMVEAKAKRQGGFRTMPFILGKLRAFDPLIVDYRLNALPPWLSNPVISASSYPRFSLGLSMVLSFLDYITGVIRSQDFV